MKEDKKKAMTIVNQLFDLAEVSVEKRQEVNDKADEYVMQQLALQNFNNRFSDEQIKKIALEMIYQMTGERIPKEEQCRYQGNANYQIAMSYLTKVNDRCLK